MKIVILGGGESGVGSAVLAHSLGHDVFLSDGGMLRDDYKHTLKSLGIPFEEGGHKLEKLTDATLVVKSPGIADNAATVKKLKELKIPIISEIEFGYRHTDAKIIAITGSNGKTTTTSLVYHILKQAGYNVALGGNIGKSFAALVAEGGYDYYVLEISSFQLDGIQDFRPDIAILLNITPDHLDRYDYKFENYIASKFRITENQTKKDLMIYWAEDPVIASNSQYFNNITRNKGVKGPFVKDGIFSIGDFACQAENISIKGPHNEINVACAVTAALDLGITHEVIANALATFVNMPHRLEYVATIGGVSFINDSKATNVDAAWYGLSAVNTPVIWIVGGTDKGNDYTPLTEQVRNKVKAIVCMGADKSKIIDFFSNIVETIKDTNSAEEAVNIAFSLANQGDTVLLSPACASFDLFNNYEHRGETFKKAVKNLIIKIES